MSTEIHQGDARVVLAGMEPENVQCAVTSPPYWGLRDYGLEPLVWRDWKNGLAVRDCEHEWGEEKTADEVLSEIQPRDAQNGRFVHKSQALTYTGRTDIACETSKINTRNQAEGYSGPRHATQGQFCQLCGAWRGSLGLEPTPELYVEHLVEVFRHVWRVLRKDGVIFLNMGDSYASGKGTCFNPGGGENSLGQARKNEGAHPLDRGSITQLKSSGLKPKDLCMMPFRVASALQADGWWLRSPIVWAKGISFCPTYSGSVMPESVNGWRWERHRIKTASKRSSTQANAAALGLRDHSGDFRLARNQDTEWRDCPGCEKCEPNDGYVLCKGSWRPTSAHEMVFLLTKTDTYYCDAEAVREDGGGKRESQDRAQYGRYDAGTGQAKRDSRTGKPDFLQKVGNDYGGSTRNLRNVWAINPQPYPEAHFATFPEKLVEPCVLAGSSHKACGACGAPWARVTEVDQILLQARSYDPNRPRSGFNKAKAKGQKNSVHGSKATKIGGIDELPHTRKAVTTTGWRPTCACEGASEARCCVLDPFAGSGTVGLVCKRLGRDFVGIELSEKYCELARKRLAVPVSKELFA